MQKNLHIICKFFCVFGKIKKRKAKKALRGERLNGKTECKLGFCTENRTKTLRKIVRKQGFLYKYVYNIQTNIWHSFCLYIMACLV